MRSTSLLEVAEMLSTAAKAIKWVESWHWPDGQIVCTRCGSMDCYRVNCRTGVGTARSTSAGIETLSLPPIPSGGVGWSRRTYQLAGERASGSLPVQRAHSGERCGVWASPSDGPGGGRVPHDAHLAPLRQEPSEARTELVRLAGRHGYTKHDLEAAGLDW